MISLLHVDGIVLLIVGLLFAVIGQGRPWLYRLPTFTIGLCDFITGVHMLGAARLISLPPWLWLRALADWSLLILLALVVLRDHPLAFGHHRKPELNLK